MNWDERKKARAKARHQLREDDKLLFNEIVSYLRDYGGEEVQELRIEEMPDGRQLGTKFRRGEAAFSFHVLGNRIFVRAGNGGQETPFDILGDAYDRMVDHELDLLARLPTGAAAVYGDRDERTPSVAERYFS